MGPFFKVDSRIWTNPKFHALGNREKLDALRDITFAGACEGFQQYVGPRYWVRSDDDPPRRRRDLCTSEWRRLRKEVLSEQGTVCHYCGCDCSDDPTVDHVVPVSSGVLINSKSNLVVACRRCNAAKGSREGRGGAYVQNN